MPLPRLDLFKSVKRVMMMANWHESWNNMAPSVRSNGALLDFHHF